MDRPGRFGNILSRGLFSSHEMWLGCAKCWGSIVERYAHAHFAASVPNFALLEAAPADTEEMLLDGWEQRDGMLLVPDTVGTGFDLEPELIERGVRADDGYRVEVRA